MFMGVFIAALSSFLFDNVKLYFAGATDKAGSRDIQVGFSSFRVKTQLWLDFCNHNHLCLLMLCSVVQL